MQKTAVQAWRDVPVPAVKDATEKEHLIKKETSLCHANKCCFLSTFFFTLFFSYSGTVEITPVLSLVLLQEKTVKGTS